MTDQRLARCRRIIQYKMSMKLWRGLEPFPMQDEHEKGKNGVGVARPGASANVECREPQPRSSAEATTLWVRSLASSSAYQQFLQAIRGVALEAVPVGRLLTANTICGPRYGTETLRVDRDVAP